MPPISLLYEYTTALESPALAQKTTFLSNIRVQQVDPLHKIYYKLKLLYLPQLTFNVWLFAYHLVHFLEASLQKQWYLRIEMFDLADVCVLKQTGRELPIEFVAEVRLNHVTDSVSM